MTDTSDLAALRTQYDGAKAAVASLEEELRDARASLEAASSTDAASDFDSHLRGETPPSMNREILQSGVDTLERLIAGGERRVSSLRRQIRDIELEEQRRIEAAMTFDDAVAFARDSLKAIDHRAAARELDAIEKEMTTIEKERLKYVTPYEDALIERENMARRGNDDGYVAADERCRAMQSKMRDARERAVVARERHEGVRRQLRSAIAGAFRHVARLLKAHADGLEAQTKSVRFLADSLAKGLTCGDQPAPATESQPPYDAILKIAALRAPILELSYRAAPEGRPEHELAGRSLHKMHYSQARR